MLLQGQCLASGVGLKDGTILHHQLHPAISCRSCKSRTRQQAAAEGISVPSTSHQASSQEQGDGPTLVPVFNWEKKQGDGTPKVRWVPVDQGELRAYLNRSIARQEAVEEGIQGRDLHHLDALHAVSAARPSDVEVPGARIISDADELQLLGRGLPIIQGEEWPGVFWRMQQALDNNRQVEVPRPHPKFTVQDLERIARRGPSFSDVVLPHAERSPEKTEQLAHAYNYVPINVLGDWAFEIEPRWTGINQLSVLEFFAGLRARNWTARPHFNPAAPPWRVQLFRCAYQEAPTGWPGLRALVTEQPSSSHHHQQGASSSNHNGSNASSSGRGAEQNSQPRKFWVDMPFSGPPVSTNSTVLEDPGSVGYLAVLAQIYQAYEQRLPKTAKEELQRKGYVTPGKHVYSCPGDSLLDVSWHETDLAPSHPLTRFLTSPSLTETLGWVQHGINSIGIFDARMMRDRLLSQYAPETPQINIQFDPNNAGPLYFLVCLTLGIVIPALRRNRILDISTLEEDPGAAQEFARSKSTARKEGLTGVEFGDVAGIGPILSEIMEVVEFLKDPKTFGKLGARPPKGMLLEGDPGTGKTLLAKALAGEAMVPFYQMAGTEFVEGIIGLGAARVRDLFKRARANAPCVIFVDEIDALGLKRAEGDGTGKVNEEREQTLNQLLTEMDGFTPDTGVVFIGATNRADLLDPALMRPGRFDRKLRMPKPDTNGRYEILQLHLRKKQVAPDVDLLQLARDLPGLAGADLANIVNEAQLNAVRAGRQAITAKDMYAGVDRFTQGERRPPLPTTHKLPILTFSAKEAGVALVASLLRQRHGRIEPVERASVQPKGRSYSRTLFARGTDEDYQVMTRGRLLDRIKVALAGHVAVRIVLGQETNTSQPDIQRACHMAHKFVFYYGMSDLGLTTWAQQPYSGDFQLGSNRPRKVVSTDAMDEYADWPTRNEDFRFDPPDPSDVTWHRYTDEVRRVVKSCYEDVWAMLQEYKPALMATVDALSEHGEMLGGELRDLFDANPPIGPYDPRVPSAAPPVLREMVLFTEKSEGKDVWPYGMDWLDTAFSTPYFVTKQAEERAAKEQAGAGV